MMHFELKRSEQNCMVEWSFPTKKEYADPFNEVDLSAVFTDPDGEEKLVCAFWAGGNVWRVRYASHKVRRHHFRTGIAPHISEGPVEVAALLHCNASIPNFFIQEFYHTDMPIYEAILKEPFPSVKDGFIELPNKPGLGIEPDEKALTKRPSRFHYPLVMSGCWGEGLKSFAKT